MNLPGSSVRLFRREDEPINGAANYENLCQMCQMCPVTLSPGKVRKLCQLGMTSRNYEKATKNCNSSSFWKKSSISGIPGRPNNLCATAKVIPNPKLTPLSVPNPSNSMPTSFRAFDASVSDAWDANDNVPPNISTSTEPVEQDRSLRASLPSSSMNGNAVIRSKSDPKSTSATKDVDPGCQSKREKIEKFLSSNQNIELEALRKLSWSGLTKNVRSKVWKILCGYLPGTSLRQDDVLQRKRQEYNQYVTQYFATKDQDIFQDTYRQIHIDIPRMSPVMSLFQQRQVQEIFERILYIWAYRHQASGYVQGMNDLVTPFFLVFLQDYCHEEDISNINVSEALTEKEIQSIEADSFWCLTKVLDGIQDNYTFAQPGIQLKIKQLEELVQRIDKELHSHLKKHEVMYLQFAFRWMNNILMRELPIKATIRLWDTYLSEIEGFSHFHLYVCAAFLIHWKSELMKKTDFHTLLMFLQNLPTAKWGDREINLLVAEAFKLSYLFADAPKHLTSLDEQTSKK